MDGENNTQQMSSRRCYACCNGEDVQLWIFNCQGLWDTDTQGPHSLMMFLVYIGGGKFVKPHVGKFLNNLVNFILNANILQAM